MKVFLSLVLLILATTVQAQSLEDFLACANFSDRVEKVFCLENALEEAVEAREDGEESEDLVVENTVRPAAPAQPAQPATPATPAQPATAATPAQPATARVEEESRFRLPRLGNIFRRNDADAEEETTVEEVEATPERLEEFGRPTRVVINEDGEDELIDVVTDLVMLRPNMWQVTLASGQVWRQTHVRRYNLREGEEVRIYPTSWGENYRLETERLSGFIQVDRVK